MNRTQIQLPDALYAQVKELAARMEISLAELTRRGLEYMVAVSHPSESPETEWRLPEAHDLGQTSAFGDPNWRASLHTDRLKVAESENGYGTSENSA